MNFRNRVLLTLAVLALILCASWALENHVRGAADLNAVPLAAPLSELPLEVGPWRGVDRPIEDERLLYADAHVQRLYHDPQRNQALMLWIAYSSEGEDRGHHPEVCMAVAGQPEDPTGRAACRVPGHEAPVQQYRFGRPGRHQLVYYWHYTLHNPEMERLSPLQRIYSLSRYRPTSMTVEVFAPQVAEGDLEGAQEFVRRIDECLQKHVGPTAVRGSQRIPVTLAGA